MAVSIDGAVRFSAVPLLGIHERRVLMSTVSPLATVAVDQSGRRSIVDESTTAAVSVIRTF